MKRFRQCCGVIAEILLGAGAVLAASKFGNFVGLPATPGYYPDDLWGYLIVPFPPLLFGALGGAALGFALLSRNPKSGFFSTVAERGAWLLGAGVALAALPGAIHPPDPFLVKHLLAHYFGMGAFIVAAGSFFREHPEKFPRFCQLAVVGVLIAVASGIRQYFWGFAETREWIAAEAAAGKPISPILLAWVNDNRVFATLNAPSALAGVILLTLPLVVVTAAEWGKKLDPARISVPLVVGIAAGATAAVGLATKSRTAVAAAIIVALAAGSTGNWSRKRKILLGIALLALALGGALYTQLRGRGGASLAERLDYARTAAIMTCEAPLSGNGWGSFQTRHRQLRCSISNESARDPHNLILALASQCGAIPGAIAAAGLLYTLINLYRQRKNSRYTTAVFWGFAAFTLQSMGELHHLIPGVSALAGALAVGALAETGKAAVGSASPRVNRLLALAIGLASLYLIWNSLQLTVEERRWAMLQDSPEPDCAALLRRYPDHPYLTRFAGDLAAKRGDLAEAERLYRRTLELCQPEAEFFDRYAAILQARGKFREAEAARRTAHNLAPQKF